MLYNYEEEFNLCLSPVPLFQCIVGLVNRRIKWVSPQGTTAFVNYTSIAVSKVETASKLTWHVPVIRPGPANEKEIVTPLKSELIAHVIILYLDSCSFSDGPP